MTELTEKLLQAIELIASRTIEAKSHFDKTVSAVIKQPLNINTGEYLVENMGAEFVAWSNDTKTVYQKDDIVYIKIPEGNMSGKKIIESLVDFNTLTLGVDFTENYEKCSVNYLRDVVEPIYELTLTKDTAADTWSAKQDYSITFSDGMDWNTFQQELKDFRYLMLSASISTNNIHTASQGNYGIEIDVYEKGYDIPRISEELDVKDFSGSYYKYTTPSTQYINFDNGEYFECDRVEIKIFAKDFKFAEAPENPIITISDIGLYSTQDWDGTTPYIIDIEDNSISEEFEEGWKYTEVTLTPKLLQRGQERHDGITWQWFEYEPAGMPAGADGFSAAAGIDWKPIQALEETATQKTWLENNNLIIRFNNQTDYWKERYFKAIATIEADSKPMIKEFMVSNHYLNNITFSLGNDSDSNIIFSVQNNGKDITKDYSIYYEMAANKKITSEYKLTIDGEGSIVWQIPDQVFTTNLSTKVNYYIYKGDNFIKKGNYTYKTNSLMLDYQSGSISIDGTSNFFYGADGSLSSSTNEFFISIPDSVVLGNTIKKIEEPKWFWKGTTEITDEVGTFIPENSMFEGIVPVKDDDKYFNRLNFTIKKKYSYSNAIDNYLTLTYSIGKKTYSQTVTFNFTLNGEMGTNGTGWVAYISERERKNVLNKVGDEILYNIDVIKDGISARPFYYNKSSEAMQPNNYRYKISFEAVNCNVTTKDIEIVLVTNPDIGVGIEGTAIYPDGENAEATKEQVISVTTSSDWNYAASTYFKAKIECYNQDSEKPEYILYYYQPVMTSSFSKEVGEGEAQPREVPYVKSNLPDSIMYDTNGYNANWKAETQIVFEDPDIRLDSIESVDNVPPLVKIVNANQIEALDYGFWIKKQQENTKTTRDGETVPIPIPMDQLILTKTFSDEEGEVTIEVYKTILFHLNRYGNEAINGWDGQSIDLDGNGKHILAPMIGAGKKNNKNEFSGVVMGVDPQQNKTGIYGYKEGEKTFGIDEDGNAYFKGDGEFEGKIIASEGEIAGWDINKNNLTKSINEFDNPCVSTTTFLQSAEGEWSTGLVGGRYGLTTKYKNNERTVTLDDAYLDGPTWIRRNGITRVADLEFVAIEITKILDLQENSEGVSIGTIDKEDSNYIYKIEKQKDEKVYTTKKYDKNTNEEIVFTNRDEVEKLFYKTSKQGKIFGIANGGLQLASRDYLNSTQNGGTLYVNNSGFRGDSYINGNHRAMFYCTYNGIVGVSYNESGEKKVQFYNTDAFLVQAYDNNKTDNPIVASLKVSTSGEGSLGGTWKVNGANIATTSDANKKNSIIPLASEYSTLFDKLQPVTYKYNDGTSDRLHTGFIAQQVKSALDESNIDSQNFAGYVAAVDEETGEKTYYLRYEEFIALNTNEIQKAKVKITELENRISELEHLLQANSN